MHIDIVFTGDTERNLQGLGMRAPWRDMMKNFRLPNDGMLMEDLALQVEGFVDPANQPLTPGIRMSDWTLLRPIFVVSLRSRKLAVWRGPRKACISHASEQHQPDQGIQAKQKVLL